MADDELLDGSEDEKIIARAIDFLQRSQEAEADNRTDALTALEFRSGKQWPPEIQNSRVIDQRPCLTINKTDAFCLQVANQQRQQRPRIKVDPTNNQATKKKADVIKGMIRHIESTRGGGDLAYDTGFDSAITMGWGYWRILSDYLDDESFDQELYLAPVDNPLACYGDPNSTLPDGSDQEEFLITDRMSKALFRKEYPGADDGANFSHAGVGDDMWVTKDDIRIAEYYYVERKKQKLIQLSDGTTVWKDKLPSPEVLANGNITIAGERDVLRRTVKWCKLTAMNALEKRELKGKYIPIVKITGKVEVIDGKRKLSGLVKNAMDPQRQYNFWRTAMTESVALAPKAKWVIAEGQDEGHEEEWNTANVSAKATLRYKPTDVAGVAAPPPIRLQPEPPPSGAIEAATAIAQDLTSVLGIVDPAMRIGGNVSGKALKAEHAQSDNSNFHYYDNMTRSIAFTGRILLDLLPYYYSGPRMVRIVGDDGRATLQAINDIETNDITVGAYDVVMDTGPGYNTKRQEAVDAMMPLMAGNEELFKIAGDLVFRNMDFPGAETIADRLAASNPLSQIDEKSEIPPAVQMKMKQMASQIEQMGQQLQAAAMEIKTKHGIEQMKQEGETRRTMIETTAKVHANDQDNAQWQRDTEANTSTKRHDTEVRAITALNVAEINAVRELLKTKVNNTHDMDRLEREADEAEREVKQKSDETESA